MNQAIWDYEGELTPARRRRLLEELQFDVIANRINGEKQVLCGHIVECCKEPGNFRVEYCVEVSEELFDIFFNSHFGYRGKYFDHPKKGLEANHLLLETLTPSLTSWAKSNIQNPEIAFISQSLLARSAKAWLAEVSKGRCELCEGEWSASYRSNLEIRNGRWENPSELHAIWGRQAPEFKKIRVLGAFLDANRKDYVPQDKKNRHKHIWKHGWS